jgi:hypothetical protein
VAGERNNYKRGWYWRRVRRVRQRRLRFLDPCNPYQVSGL